MRLTKVEDITQSASVLSEKLEVAIKPFLACLSIAGLRRRHIVTEEKNIGIFRQLIRWKYMFYAIIILLLLWSNFLFSLKDFASVHAFDGKLCKDIISSAWFLQVAFYAANNLVMGRHWPSFYTAWDKYAENTGTKTRSMVRKLAIFLTIVYACWVVSSCVFLTISALQTRANTTASLSLTEAIFVNIFLFTAYFYFVSTWFLLTAQFALACFMFYRAFREQYRDLKLDVEEKCSVSNTIESHRLRHDNLCRLVSQADSIFSMFIFVTVATAIPLIVFTLYFVMFETTDTFSYGATWWSVILCTVQLFVIFIGGAAVNTAAHGSLDLLYKIDLQDVPIDKLQKLTIFLSRLNARSIGFSAFDLFIIDKPTVVTFFGSILTYAIVVIQFRSCTSGSLALSSCNRTSA
ncbi:hypothetical protein CHS0354_028252 [Potamilus streckersoni]|uniref:Gustatory receptor n=1 Tax=Potamilus streckersoni TaxID=2493646 RepID=A0AAE0VJ26_9BIVA|nr:hypothetical protein CHS0354_028252 [Potamilus streckersoni]